jgi:hypothetical protein
MLAVIMPTLIKCHHSLQEALGGCFATSRLAWLLTGAARRGLPVTCAMPGCQVHVYVVLFAVLFTHAGVRRGFRFSCTIAS